MDNVQDEMIEIVFGSFFLVFALIPGGKFRWASGPGLKPLHPPIEPSWIPRLFFMAIGLGFLIDGVRDYLYHH